MNDTVRGKYRIVREIARSNDIVYEAMDTGLNRRLAIKELNIAPGMTGQARRERVERFEREAHATSRLQHQNIVTIYDHWEEKGRHFIAMEYLDGQTLRDMMQAQGALPLKDAINIAAQTLSALAHAHDRKVIHRDIKPDNIFVLPGGHVKLTDFGIARLTEQPALTSNGQVFGTPSYMSPEQIEGKHIDHRSDLFSVGVLLYEMLAGRKPFTGDSVISITYAIMNAPAPALSGIPGGVEQVIHRALSKRPEQRQMSADQMRQDLQSAEQTPAVFLPSPSSGVILRRTNMGGAAGYGGAQSGMNGGYADPDGGYGNPGQRSGGASAYNTPNAGYSVAVSNPNYGDPNAGQMQASGGADANGLPWAWNTTGAGQAGAQTKAQKRAAQQTRAQAYNAPAPSYSQPSANPSLTAQQVAAMTPQQAAQYAAQYAAQAGYNPHAPFAPPVYARPRQPLIVLSPSARTTLQVIIGAIILGCVLAFSCLAFAKRYDAYKESAGSAQVQALMTQGSDAYAHQNYSEAIKAFESALNSHPDALSRDYLQKNLAYAYTQQARQAKAAGDIQNALTYYGRAVTYAPDYKVAHDELAVLKESTRDVQGAQSERQAAQISTFGQQPPATLSIPPVGNGGASPAVNPNANADPNQFTRSKSQEAQQFLREGDQLLMNNDVRGALRKWRDARDAAPGLPEHDQAQSRISQYESTVSGDSQ